MRREVHSISPLREETDWQGRQLVADYLPPHMHQSIAAHPTLPSMGLSPHRPIPVPQVFPDGTQIAQPQYSPVAGRFREISPDSAALGEVVGQSPQQVREDTLYQRAEDVAKLQAQLAELFRASISTEPLPHVLQEIQRVQAALADAARNCEEVALSPVAAPSARNVSPSPVPERLFAPAEVALQEAGRVADRVVAEALSFACQRRPLRVSPVLVGGGGSAFLARSVRDPRLQFLVVPCSIVAYAVDHGVVEACLQESDTHHCAGVVMVVPRDTSIAGMKK